MSFLKTFGAGIKSAFTDSGIETPGYTVIADHGEYEERSYPATMWVSHTNKKMLHSQAVRESFWELFNYISGKNEKDQKIDMTAPVAIKVEAGAGPNCESTFTTSFFIGKEHQESPPKPNNPALFIDTWKPQTVYVRRFPGFAKDDTWIDEAQKLATSLKPEHPVLEEYHITCGYNSPFKLFNRRNEVWLIKKENNSETQNNKEENTTQNGET